MTVSSSGTPCSTSGSTRISCGVPVSGSYRTNCFLSSSFLGNSEPPISSISTFPLPRTFWNWCPPLNFRRVKIHTLQTHPAANLGKESPSNSTGAIRDKQDRNEEFVSEMRLLFRCERECVQAVPTNCLGQHLGRAPFDSFCLHFLSFNLSKTSTSTMLIPPSKIGEMISASAGRFPLRSESAASFSTSHFGAGPPLDSSQKLRQSYFCWLLSVSLAFSRTALGGFRDSPSAATARSLAGKSFTYSMKFLVW